MNEMIRNKHRVSHQLNVASHAMDRSLIYIECEVNLYDCLLCKNYQYKQIETMKLIKKKLDFNKCGKVIYHT